MKYGNHENWCNGPGDCSCGEDSGQAGESAITRSIEQGQELRLKNNEIERLKAQVKYWKGKSKR